MSRTLRFYTPRGIDLISIEARAAIRAKTLGDAGCRPIEEPTVSSEVMTRPSQRADVLRPWTSVLAGVAHPDDESYGLGAILDAFARAGAGVELLCVTNGGASTLHGPPGDLAFGAGR